MTLKASMSDYEFMVVGLARDCENKIKRDVFALVDSIGFNNKVSWLIVESDSADNTVNVLTELANKIPKFRLKSLGALRNVLPSRTQRIAHCRNAYLSEIKSNPLYADVDYVIVADFDGVNELITASGLSSCWERSDWDVCAANQRGPYYDIWALRHKLWSPNDCWKEYQFLVEHGVNEEKARQASLYTKMITISESSDWIEVDSAFGGLAVYRREVLAGVAYKGVDEAGAEICEHVPFHSQIKANGGRIFINPRLINARETEHSHALHIMSRIRRLYLDCRRNAMKAFHERP